MTMDLNQTIYSSAAIGKTMELMIKAALLDSAKKSQAADVSDQRWMKRALQPVKEGA